MKIKLLSFKLSFLAFWFILFIFPTETTAQRFYYGYGTRPKANYLGLSFSTFRDTTYATGDWDLNILPITIKGDGDGEYKRFESRARFFLLYGIRKEQKNHLKGWGFEFAWPIYFKEKDEYSEGFYVAPAVQLLMMNTFQDVWNSEFRLRLGAEPGYQLLIGETYAVTMGLQLGGMLYVETEFDNTQWKPYLGFTLIFGSYIDPF